MRRGFLLVLGLGLSHIIALANCASPPPSKPAAPVAVTPPPSAASASPVVADAGVATASPREDRCPPINEGEISDDDTPSVRGADKTAELFPWLDARGIEKKTALAVLLAHYGRGVFDPENGESSLGSGSCLSLEIGDKHEAALLCRHDVPRPLVEEHAVVIVVRNKKPVVLFDVGLSLVALDFPDARWLDLAVEIKDGGRTFEVRDRAPNGRTLVAPPSFCKAREATLDQCEKDFGFEPEPEQYAHPGPRGTETFAFYNEVCPVERGPDKKLRIFRGKMDTTFGPYPATIHDCAGGRAELLRAQKESGSPRGDWRRPLAFLDKSCEKRGVWKWKGDRFVR